MFLETITVPADAYAVFVSRVRLFTDPPAGLLSAVSYEEGPDGVTMVMLWGTPAARGDFAAERVMSSFADGELPGDPDRRTPVDVHVHGVTRATV